MENQQSKNLSPAESIQRLAALQNNLLSEVSDILHIQDESTRISKYKELTKHVCAISVEMGRLEMNHPEAVHRSKLSLEDLDLLTSVQILSFISRYTGLQQDDIDKLLFDVGVELLSFKDEAEAIEWVGTNVFAEWWTLRYFTKAKQVIVETFQEGPVNHTANKRIFTQAVCSLSGTTDNYNEWIENKEAFQKTKKIINDITGMLGGSEPDLTPA